ncbi:hypothetical protein EDC04DRAFT_2597737 [Pisolithus marmoratus]|nr:hypothetical protein EDC04DRAFT_2597737 [Pisolithus marmoratus]
MQRGPSYSTQSSNVHVVSDRFLPPFSRGVVCSQQQQERDPYHVPYGAPRYCSAGEDFPHQSWNDPSLSYCRPVTSSEYNRHFRNRLSRAVALAPALGTYGTRDYHPHADDVKNAEVSMVHSTLADGIPRVLTPSPTPRPAPSTRKLGILFHYGRPDPLETTGSLQW